MTKQALTKTSERFPTFFDDFFKPWNEWFDNENTLWSRQARIPSVNITENKDEYNVSLAVPGMKKDEIEIELTDGVLTLSGERKLESSQSGEQYHRIERQPGN